MAYVTPSVLVYQQLETSGGVLNSTPDLHACIIGPCYTEVTYVAGSTDALVLTSAKSATTTSGTATVGSKDVTVVSISGFFAGDSVILEGAGASAGPLAASVVSVVGSVVTLDTAVVTAVTGASLSKKGLLVNPAVPNTYSLPGVKPGQVVVAPETKVYLTNVLVNTVTTQASGHSQGNVLTVTSFSTTGSATSGASTVTVASASGIVVGDSITVVGAGTSGVNLVANVINVVGSVLTLATPIVTTVTTVAVTKNNPLLVNSLTNTYTAEAGDTLKIAYTNTSSVSSIFTTLVKSVASSAGGITNLTLTDALPSDMGVRTTATTVVSTTNITVASPTRFSVNRKVRVV